MEIIASETINDERSTRIELLEAPEQLLVWKNRYRLRVGDVIRTDRLKFIVRRVVPPDENARHSGWVDVEIVFGMVLDPQALPANPPLLPQATPRPPQPNQNPFGQPPPAPVTPIVRRPIEPPSDEPEFGQPLRDEPTVPFGQPFPTQPVQRNWVGHPAAR